MKNNTDVDQVYEFMGLSQSCVYMLDELELLSDNDGLFNLNLAIKEDISQKYDKKRTWFNQVLTRLVKLGFVKDLSLGRYRLNTDSEFSKFIDHVKDNPVKQITFAVTLDTINSTKTFKITSIDFITTEASDNVAQIA